MSTIQMCLCALHSDMIQNGCNLDIEAARLHIDRINIYFKSDITSIQSEVALKTLFADDKGIVVYTKALIDLESNNTNIIIADILFLFFQLIESFPMNIVYYINSIKAICVVCTTTKKKNASLSIKAYEIYEKLLVSSNFSNQLEIDKIVEHLDNEASLGLKISTTVRQHIYNLFGVIAQYHPMYLRNYEDKLMNLFCYELQLQVDKWERNVQKFSLPVAIGCLNGLTGFLNNFAHHIETYDYRIRLYEILKKLIGKVEEKRRHVINRTALQLFQNHIQLFLKLLFQDTIEIEWFQHKLWEWCLLSNSEDKTIGLLSFEVLYKGASIEFLQNFKTTNLIIKNTHKNIIEIMIKFLKLKIYNHKLHFQEHAVVVKSIGWLSESCKNLLGEEKLIEIFYILLFQAEEKYLNYCFKRKMYDPNAANYLNSLSLIIKNLKTINFDQFFFIQKLSIYCFEDFISAQSKSDWQNNISNAIIISIYCLASSHEDFFDKYLEELFYIGLIKSCSHRASIDAKIVEEYTGNVIIKSINYVPLWISLLKAHQCHSFDLYLNIPLSVKSRLEKSLMCCFMSSFLKIIMKLDLITIKSMNELEMEYVARKPSDFTILINLVEIYSNIFNDLEIDNETSLLWLPHTINVIINHSIELPTVSSLYKILTIIFQKLDWFTLLENIKNNYYKENIIKYVNCLMEYIHTFRGDLQFCCLEMLLSLPSTIVKEIFNIHILAIVKTALIVGSTFLPLAKITINTLQRWNRDISKKEMDQLLKYIMPYLDLLLRTKGLMLINIFIFLLSSLIKLYNNIYMLKNYINI